MGFDQSGSFGEGWTPPLCRKLRFAKLAVGKDHVDQLSTIDVPVLFITGEYDEARPRTVQYFQSLVKGSQFDVIKGAGHGTMHDNKKQNIKVIRDFLKGLGD